MESAPCTCKLELVYYHHCALLNDGHKYHCTRYEYTCWWIHWGWCVWWDWYFCIVVFWAVFFSSFSCLSGSYGSALQLLIRLWVSQQWGSRFIDRIDSYYSSVCWMGLSGPSWHIKNCLTSRGLQMQVLLPHCWTWRGGNELRNKEIWCHPGFYSSVHKAGLNAQILIYFLVQLFRSEPHASVSSRWC